ncbi:MAG TPA: HDOD domain-containing protein [Polyangiaceae bacterium]|jgi:putative nucleotidyltransferase with HDIG domain|nr:HDOD domain-containing protein [Polyangiaceae bacterium]
MAKKSAAQGAAKNAGIADSLIEELWFGDETAPDVKELAAKSLSAKLAELRGMKPFPVVAERIMTLVADQRVRLEEVARVLETDPGLAARTLALSNSALFLVGRPCDSVNQAILRVGTKALYEMMAAVAMLEMFEDVRGIGIGFREHCVGVAAISRALVKSHGWDGASQVFLVGLFHDVGKLLSMDSQELPYDALPPEYLDFDTVHLHERRLVGYDHAVLGGHVLKQWNLPDTVARAVAWHHQPGRAYANGGDEALLVAIVRVADRIDHAIVRGIAPDEPFLQEMSRDAALSYLELQPEEIARAWPTFIDARVSALSVFGGTHTAK